MDKTLIFVLVTLIMAGCAKKQVRQPEKEVLPVTQIIGIGKIVPEGGISELASPASGIVTELPVAEGSKVKKGEVLIQLANAEQALAVLEIDKKITSQQKSIESERWLIEQKKIAMADKLRKLTDAKDLLKSGATTGENVRTLQNDYDQASQEMKKLENDLAMQQSQLNEISAQKAIKKYNLQQTTLKAPMDGIILDILPKAGEALSQYQTYARLAPDKPLIVQAEIDEMFAGKLALGQKCSVRLSGENKQVASGKVIHISADLKKKSLFSDSRDDLEDRRVREVEISLDSVSRPLLINTKVECTIQIK
ncbi:MAG: efflux RND transporter periplasmic adaptor subunit [Bacteroidota bacterium]|nr:efflux RND transporter periplasmic adaptor subunit [Bacteroidota bacterium]